MLVEEVNELTDKMGLRKVEQRVQHINTRVRQRKVLVRVHLLNFMTENKTLFCGFLVKDCLLLQKADSMNSSKDVSESIDLQKVSVLEFEPETWKKKSITRRLSLISRRITNRLL